ncbi:MAG: hypothetical protein A2138_08735 [Deltaproteobacteria bacterium RBG_16_71_12]|nr:MAG: hypothetical protein A2138_08735 [Deltaproteobacteria bacterium RBG_16_71_12]
MATRRLRLGLTPGCPAGIGPEVLARALVEAELPRGAYLRFFSSAAVLALGAKRAGVPCALDEPMVLLGRGRRRVPVEVAAPDVDDAGSTTRAGKPDDAALRCQRDALVRGCVAAAAGNLDALVTGPVRKHALVVDGVPYPGQTEVFHALVAPEFPPPLMVFVGGPFVLGLATVHLSLADVSAAITPALVERALAQLHAAARKVTEKRAPRLVVLGVNPHAGEGGRFGTEEQDVVAPAIERARARGLKVFGPVPADGFYADHARGRPPPDAVLAMHHDQGLAPYKLLCAGEGVNVTWGLPVLRTSPDHGTADALAGKGKASWLSMRQALETAARLTS